MNILLINHYAGSKFHGMELRPFYLAKEWVRLGHQVTIVAASFSHVRTIPPNINEIVTEENIEGIRYVWIRTPRYFGNGVWRGINILTFVWRLLYHKNKLTQNGDPDIVISSSTYPLDVIPAHRIAKRYGANLIFEVHDLWPLSLIELGRMPPRHPFILLLQWAEDFAYRNADSVVSILPKAQSYMCAHGMAKHKFFYLPNGIDVSEWQNSEMRIPEEHSQMLVDLKKSGRFIVGYAGALGLANALDSVIEAASLLRTEPVTFVLVGQGPERPRLERAVLQRGLTNVLFLPPISKIYIPGILKEMNALYIGLKKESLFRFGVSPNKLIDYMMAAKPVIYAIKAGNDLVKEAGCGISIPSENPSAIAAAVLKVMDMNQVEREKMGLNGRRYVLTHHDYRILAQQFLKIMANGN